MKSKLLITVGILALSLCGCGGLSSNNKEKDRYLNNIYTNKLFEYATYNETEDVLTSYQINFIYNPAITRSPLGRGSLCFEKVYYGRLDEKYHNVYKDKYYFSFNFEFVDEQDKDIEMTFISGWHTVGSETTNYSTTDSEYLPVPEPVIAHCSGTTNEDLKVHFDEIFEFKNLDLTFLLESMYQGASYHQHVLDEEWSAYSEADDVNDGVIAKHCYCGYAEKRIRVFSSSHMEFSERVLADYHYYSLSSFTMPEDNEKNHLTEQEREQFPGRVRVPETYNGLSVNAIGQRAFNIDYYGNIKEIYIPKTITTIGTATLENSYAEENNQAFINRSGWDFIEGIKIIVDEENDYFKSIDGALYTKNGKILIFPGAIQCKEITNDYDAYSYTVNNNVEIVGQQAFIGFQLTNITFGNNVKTLRREAFHDCRNLREVILNASLQTIGKDTFLGCSNLYEITYKGTKTQWDSIEKDEYWVSGSSVSVVHCSDGDVQVTQI